MNNSNYIIRLKPLENYYFGGEKTFRNNESGKVNYFARSNYYPQQTSLLGLLRYVLLLQNNALPLKENLRKGNSLIGEKSFDATVKEKQNFGVINSVSELLIAKGEKFYRIAHPLDELEVEFIKGKSKAAGNVNGFIPRLKNYNPKNHFKNYVINKDGKTKKISKIFQLTEQIGININSTEEGFYKQQLISLKKDYEFVFIVNINNEYLVNGRTENTKLSNTIVSFGGEQKQFFFNAKIALDHNIKKSFPDNPQGNRIVLLSDAFVSNEILNVCKFSINESENFRTVSNAFDGAGFSYLKMKYNLLKKGSILFADNDKSKQDIMNLLIEQSNFRQVGFNQFFVK